MTPANYRPDGHPRHPRDPRDPRIQGDSRQTPHPADEPVMIGAGLYDVEARLRSALHDDAASITPGNRLANILDTAHSVAPLSFLDEPRSRWPRPWLAMAAAASVAAVVAGSLWVSGRPSTPISVATAPASPTGITTSEPRPSLTSGSPQLATTGGGTGTTSAPGGSLLANLPVYWIGETGGSPKLFREFRAVPDTGGGKIEAAVAAMTRMTPLDPDYVTPWRPASRVDVTQSGSSLTVDLSADAIAATNLGSGVAERAVQQLVWTATAAASVAGTPATTVTILIDGKAADAWGAVRLGQPTQRSAQLEVLSHAWLTKPQEGDTRAAGLVTFEGSGTSFEATFHWKITRPDGTAVASGSVMGGDGTGGFGTFTFTQRLDPGTYVVELATDDPSGGAEGNGPDVDTKTFTVR